VEWLLLVPLTNLELIGAGMAQLTITDGRRMDAALLASRTSEQGELAAG
jgi:hypothetical protein